MKHHPIRAFVPTVWHLHARNSRLDDEHGFTLIELLIVCAITPIIVGGLALALISLLSLSQATQNKISDTTDAQIISSYYERDSPRVLSRLPRVLLLLNAGPERSYSDWSGISIRRVANTRPLSHTC